MYYVCAEQTQNVHFHFHFLHIEPFDQPRFIVVAFW